MRFLYLIFVVFPGNFGLAQNSVNDLLVIIEMPVDTSNYLSGNRNVKKSTVLWHRLHSKPHDSLL